MANLIIAEKSEITSIADAIRNKNDTTDTMSLNEMATAIGNIQTSSGTENISLQSKTVTPSESKQTVSPDNGYDGLSSVTVNAISSTYIGSGVTKKSAATYTPSTSNQTIASGQYLSGTQTIKGDANLASGNIKSGVSIFGINGSYEGSGGIDTSDATATASDIVSPTTAYVNGEKVTGTLTASAIDTTVGAYYIGIDSDDYLYFTLANTESLGGKRHLVDVGQSIKLKQPSSSFGDATAEDVVAGKTFTSSSGVKVTGTLDTSTSSNSIETFNITSVDDVITPTISGTVKVYGYGYYSASTYSKTNYCFVGDGYYIPSTSSFGTTTPTKTSATFSIGSDGKLSGLPQSSFATLDILVVIES